MIDLTPRQKLILQNVIEEYVNSGVPVGSNTLEKKFELGVSPATIRNEMVKLTQKGFLVQPHTSAGRIPTARALKFYVRNLMKEQSLSVADEVGVKEKIWDHRFKVEKLLKEATRILSEKTNTIAFACTAQGDLFHSGYARILEVPEFFNIDVTRTLLSLIEEVDQIQHFLSYAVEKEPVHLVFGEEVGVEFLEPIGLVFTDIEMGENLPGSLGVVGSSRLDYSRVIPFVKYVGSLISELMSQI